MRAEDQFHVGIVVDDLEAGLTMFGGFRWCEPIQVRTPVVTADGDLELDLRFTYSKHAPRVEVIQAVPGTLWVPAESGLHHLGYWSDDVAGDAADLESRGFVREASGGSFTYHRHPAGPRIELVDRAVQAGLEGWWGSEPE